MTRSPRGAGNKHTNSCFLNIPYDSEFEALLLAYISGLTLLGLTPRAAAEITAGDRLTKILALISSCEYSIHDLSRVELDRIALTPRFNMPFEAGLAVALNWSVRRSAPNWFLFESQPRRLQKSLSDLSGYDPLIHHGTPEGIFGQLNNAFRRIQGPSPTVSDMTAVYGSIIGNRPIILRETGTTSAFEASAFREVVVLAQETASRQLSLIPRKPASPSH